MGRTENIDNGSSNEEKVALFRELFFGRQDVYARRFENAKSPIFRSARTSESVVSADCRM